MQCSVFQYLLGLLKSEEFSRSTVSCKCFKLLMNVLTTVCATGNVSIHKHPNSWKDSSCQFAWCGWQIQLCKMELKFSSGNVEGCKTQNLELYYNTTSYPDDIQDCLYKTGLLNRTTGSVWSWANMCSCIQCRCSGAYMYSITCAEWFNVYRSSWLTWFSAEWVMTTGHSL